MAKNIFLKKELGEQVPLKPENSTHGTQNENDKPQKPDNDSQSNGNTNPLKPQESNRSLKFNIKK